MSAHDLVPQLTRFASGIPGLDRVLDGGFLGGGVYIVEGAPGAGKTIFANQIAFHHARQGKRVVYITLLAESHTRMLQHLQGMTFFDGSVIPERLTYVSAFRALEEGGLKALVDIVGKELRGHHPSIAVLDGFAAVGESAASHREFKKLVYDLQVYAGLANCTFFLLSSGLTDEGSVQPVHTMVDGLVRLNDATFGVRAQRQIQVQKFRGSRYLRGVHAFEIGADGLCVHPRLESFSADLADASTSEKLGTGVQRLDEMLGGGLRLGSTTMILGPTGTGKSLLGYTFLAQSHADQRGLLFSFYETPKRALDKAASVGLPLDRLCQAGHLELAWQTPVETSLDVIGGRLLDAIDRAKVKRVFIDGFNGFQSASAYPERVEQFFGALTRELRARGVTALYAAEIRAIFAPQIQSPAHGVSPLLENLILMRFVELSGQLRRVVSVLKTRDSDFDTAIRGFTITSHGVEIGEGFSQTEDILTGAAHERPGRG